ISMQFLYDYGQGHIADKHGVEPIDLVVDEELFAIETISSRTQFLKNRPLKRSCNPTMDPTAEKMNSEDVATESCNK
ncbi:hypothetical protein CLU79DRAFT_708115, partial [Phycomyces nitens]